MTLGLARRGLIPVLVFGLGLFHQGLVCPQQGLSTLDLRLVGQCLQVLIADVEHY